VTGEIFALFAAVFWSLQMIFAKKAVAKNAQSANPMDPMVGLFITILVNNMVNIVVLTVRYVALPSAPINTAGVIAIAIVGVSNSFVGRGLFFLCVAILGAARTGLTRSSMPVFVLLGGVLVLGERFGPRAWIGIGIVFLSLFLMSLDTVRRENKKQSEAALLDAANDKAAKLRLIKGIAIGMGAAMILGGGSILRKAGIDLLSDTILAVSIDSFSALCACVAVLLIKRKGRDIVRAIKNIEFNYMMSGVFASAGLYAMMYSLSLIPVAITNSIAATEPLFTIFFVWILKEGQKEKLGIQTLLFGVIMVIGTIILITSGTN